ncbi:SMC-Scp complex subunit ScpB [bacterium]|nr:SMC-Scp complex subunit ScpB [bacterium]
MTDVEVTPEDDPIGLNGAEALLPPDDKAADEPVAAEPDDAEADADDERPELGEDLFDPVGLSPAEQGALLVALLFAAGETVAADRLMEYFRLEPDELSVLVDETAGSLRPQGLDIIGAAGGYKLVTAAQWDSYLSSFHRKVRKAKLSKSALEILAVIAYEQPVTRSRVDELRQVNSESTVRSLLDKRLITVAGRAESPGRPFIYKTTAHFLEVFGLASLDDLPPRPPSLEKARGIDLGTRSADDEAPGGLEDLPGFDTDMLEQDELED